MCDEITAQEATAALAAKGLTRRDFAGLGPAAALIACTGATEPPLPALAERMVSIPTPDGTADGFLVSPAGARRKPSPHPAVLMWPDIAGSRDAYKTMARRIAAAGYTVLVVNQYYRAARAPVMESFAPFLTPEGRARLAPMIAALTPDRVSSDAAAYLAFLDAQPETSRQHRMGVCGYCMGGPFAVRSAVASARVGAVASLHGGGLVTPTPDSPHRLLGKTHARFLFAIAQNDDARAPTDKDALRATAAEAHREAEIEVYAADHGWCTLDAPSYNRAEADRALARMLALFSTL